MTNKFVVPIVTSALVITPTMRKRSEKGRKLLSHKSAPQRPQFSMVESVIGGSDYGKI